MKYNLHSKLPDVNLDPPEADDLAWDYLTHDEKIERLSMLPKDELVELYLDALYELAKHEKDGMKP